jgi:hypothetical protein
MNQMDQFRAILVDDNPWILSLWQAEARNRQAHIAVFDSASQFHKAADSFDRSIPLFIDYSIDANGIMALNISQFARQAGFKSIFYATGHQPSDIKTDLVDGVVGKTPPIWLWNQEAKLLSSDERTFLAANMNADQRSIFRRRMNEIYDAEFNSEIALPAKVAQIWTDAVYRSLSDEDLRLQIESAWRLANESV